jgi:hypothetical protein
MRRGRKIQTLNSIPGSLGKSSHAKQQAGAHRHLVPRGPLKAEEQEKSKRRVGDKPVNSQAVHRPPFNSI